ncbi:MAG: hypothetical protein WAX44_03885 [Minisyncoccia bacterium]
MKKYVFSLVLAFAFLLSNTASAAGVGQGLQDLATLLGQDSVGQLISGVIYGNTSNPSGNGNGVLPSLSPGPWRCTNPLDCAGPTTAGGSMGDFISPLTSGGNSSSDFANGKTPGPDFSN